MAGEIFDPLDKKNFADSIARALLNETLETLPLQEKFSGPGVYALYYVGSLPVYSLLAKRRKHDWPIYVGKAESASSTKTPLFSRIGEHVRSIVDARDLSPEDFRCRYLLVDDAWVRFAEIILIDKYRPLWNSTCLPGLGGHAPGSGRGKQKQSLWDTLHPGRQHAANRPKNPTPIKEIEASVQRYLRETISGRSV